MTNSLNDISRQLFSGLGTVSQRMRGVDWSSNPLGAPADWPPSLQSIVRMLLTTRYQMWMAWGPELTFLCNDAYRPTLGVKFPWAIGQSAREVWSEIWPEIGPLIEHVLTTGEATYSEGMLLVLERSGFPEETYHTFSYSPLFSETGAVAGMLCVVVEETERVINERRLGTLRELASASAVSKTEDELFRNVVATLSRNPRDLPFTLFYLLDEDGENLRGAGSTGLDSPHQLSRTITRCIADHGSDLQPWLMKLDRVQELPSGVWKAPPREVLIAPFSQQAGETMPAGYLVVGLNPYRPSDQNYQSFVGLVAGQLGAALASVRAYEAEKRRAEALAEIDRAKTTFFSNVSHEFRTPLTLMLGPLEDVLANPELSDGVGPQLQLAHRNGIRLLRLVNALLDFSRIEAGRTKAHYVPTDLGALTSEVASSFRSATDKARLFFRVQTEPLPHPVFVDGDMWEKILLNLISNAFKFTFEGGLTVSVGPSADGMHAEVSIADTGIGIAADEIPKLFERFHRVEGARGRSFEGSGIGLALVRELIQLHGGSIGVQSTPGLGSIFTIRIPFGSAHLPDDLVDEHGTARRPGSAHAYVEEALRWLPTDIQLEAGGPVRGSHQNTGRGMRIVLADDNSDMREYVNRLLVTEGYEVTAVANGQDALAALSEKPHDLVLSDIMMPVMNGFDLLKAVRRDPTLAPTPVILLSARAGEEAKVEGLDAGAVDYLTKPFAARELLARVGANIKLARLRKEAEQALRHETRALAILNRSGTAVSGNVDVGTIVQSITDAGVELTGAAFGAFFYNVINDAGESYMLYSLSGVPREAFSKFPMPRNTKVFAPTFSGDNIVRSDDITQDPRYGHNDPHKGMPEGHLPVRSYLAVPVKSRDGSVLSGLFFGHSEIGVFGARAEEFMISLAAQAAVAIDNAKLFQGTQREIRQRHDAERNLQLLNAGLEEKIASEVADRLKVEDALRQAQKMEAVGQLTGGVAHDFNNLLTIIVGGLDTIRRAGPKDNPRLTRALDMALQGVQRAATLTSRLLAFSRRHPLEPKPLDLNKVVRASTELLHRTLGETIELESVLGARLWTVEVDQNQLESAVINLAINARDAMPDGGKLTIETSNAYLDESYTATDAEVVPGQYATLSITDNGCGMSKETLTRVFEPFFTTKGVGKGTGLGLSMVYGFVKQSGGHVTIYSEENHGTTVKLYFPRYAGAAENIDSVASAGVPAGVVGETVLVVEDNPDVRANSVAILTELGYVVLEAEDADEALGILNQEGRIDVLFTDVVLPGKSGRVLADEALKLRTGLKILFTTGYSRNAIVHQGRLDPGVNLISKPFSFEQLAMRMRDILDA